jgi:hypothetical protein
VCKKAGIVVLFELKFLSKSSSLFFLLSNFLMSGNERPNTHERVNARRLKSLRVREFCNGKTKNALQASGGTKP